MSLLAAPAPTGQGEAYGLIFVGLFLLAGFAAHVLGRRVHVPRVTLLLLLGFLAGPSVFQLVPEEASAWFPLVARIALSIIGFQLGERFLGKKLRETGRTIMLVSLTEVFAAAAAVFVALLSLGVPVPLALMLASIAPATAPAATLDVVREAEADGPVTDTVLGVVAIDDAWGVILFSVLLVAVQTITGQNASAAIVLDGLWEVGGGIALGIGIGVPMAALTGRVRLGELTLVETLGFVFVCSGLAVRLDLSHILACMAMGATVSNLARHHERPFHAIEEVEQPFLILFFLLAGFDFDASRLPNIGLIGLTYVAARSVGKIGGGSLGGVLASAHRNVRKYTGFCLLPQAGVALGLALMVSERYPQVGRKVLSTIVGTTIVFELIGPVLTRFALRRAGEISETDGPVREEDETDG